MPTHADRLAGVLRVLRAISPADAAEIERIHAAEGPCADEIPQSLREALVARAGFGDRRGPAADIADGVVGDRAWDWLVAGSDPLVPEAAEVYDAVTGGDAGEEAEDVRAREGIASIHAMVSRGVL